MIRELLEIDPLKIVYQDRKTVVLRLFGTFGTPGPIVALLLGLCEKKKYLVPSLSEGTSYFAIIDTQP
jgi:hypothetical protein